MYTHPVNIIKSHKSKKKLTFKIASLKSNRNNEVPWIDFVKIKKNKQKINKLKITTYTVNIVPNKL